MHNLRGHIFHDYPLAKQTSWKIGGPAKVLYRPVDIIDLHNFLLLIRSGEIDSLIRDQDELDLVILGAGSNVLISDQGINAPVIQLHAFNHVDEAVDGLLRVEAGVSCAQLVRYNLNSGRIGCAFLAGIPGTIGGALAMNAGAHGGCIWNHVAMVETLDHFGDLHLRQADEFSINYRSVKMPGHEFFIAAYLNFSQGDVHNEKKLIKKYMQQRMITQPVTEYSCGSVFRNPPGDHAARLIEECGFKGRSYGRAQVSPKHANFIINKGGATAQDVLQLIDEIQAAVGDKFGVKLQLEAKLLGV